MRSYDNVAVCCKVLQYSATCCSARAAAVQQQKIIEQKKKTRTQRGKIGTEKKIADPAPSGEQSAGTALATAPTVGECDTHTHTHAHVQTHTHAHTHTHTYNYTRT